MRSLHAALSSGLRRLSRPGGRTVVVISLAAYFLLLALLYGRLGYVTSWSDLGVSSMPPVFGDLRNITSAFDCHREGFDPLVADPCDPWHRPMNYPRVFLLPERLGLDQRATVWVGSLLVAAFFACALAWVGDGTILDGLIFAALLCSPAVMLAVERGNNDILIFCLLIVAIGLLKERGRTRSLAYMAIGAASILKFYPIVAIASALREGPRRAVLVLSLVLGTFLAYIVATWKDVELIISTVPRTDSISYGRSVLFIALERGYHLRLPHGASIVAALLVCLSAYFLAHLTSGPDRSASTHLDGFRIGASIFIGTFLLGSSWNYRLLFLLLVVPQLLEWIKTEGNSDRLAKWVLGGVLFTLWSSFLSRWSAAGLGPAIFLVKESVNWLLLFALLYLLLQTLPSWLKARVLVLQPRSSLPVVDQL
jgi:hypothetical protein